MKQEVDSEQIFNFVQVSIDCKKNYKNKIVNIINTFEYGTTDWDDIIDTDYSNFNFS